MNLQAVGRHVLVKRDKPQQVSPGGVYVIGETPPGSGVVLSFGTASTFPVSKGDTVYFAPYAGNEITFEGEKILVLNGDDIIARVAPK